MIIFAIGLIATTLAFTGYTTVLTRVVRNDGTGVRAARRPPPRSHPQDMFEPRPWF